MRKIGGLIILTTEVERCFGPLLLTWINIIYIQKSGGSEPVGFASRSEPVYLSQANQPCPESTTVYVSLSWFYLLPSCQGTYPCLSKRQSQKFGGTITQCQTNGPSQTTPLQRFPLVSSSSHPVASSSLWTSWYLYHPFPSAVVMISTWQHRLLNECHPTNRPFPVPLSVETTFTQQSYSPLSLPSPPPPILSPQAPVPGRHLLPQRVLGRRASFLRLRHDEERGENQRTIFYSSSGQRYSGNPSKLRKYRKTPSATETPTTPKTSEPGCRFIVSDCAPQLRAWFRPWESSPSVSTPVLIPDLSGVPQIHSGTEEAAAFALTTLKRATT